MRWTFRILVLFLAGAALLAPHYVSADTIRRDVRVPIGKATVTTTGCNDVVVNIHLRRPPAPVVVAPPPTPVFGLSLSLNGGAYGISRMASGMGELQIDLRAPIKNGWGITTQLLVGGQGPIVGDAMSVAGVGLLASWQGPTVRVQFGLEWKTMFDRMGGDLTNVVAVPFNLDIFLHSKPLPGRFFYRFSGAVGVGVWRSGSSVDQVIGVTPENVTQDLKVHGPHTECGIYWQVLPISFGVNWDFVSKQK